MLELCQPSITRLDQLESCGRMHFKYRIVVDSELNRGHLGVRDDWHNPVQCRMNPADAKDATRFDVEIFRKDAIQTTKNR